MKGCAAEKLALSADTEHIYEGKLPGFQALEYGWRWPVDVSAWPGQTRTFQDWRSMAAAAMAAPASAKPAGARDVLCEIMNYDLAGTTPLAALLAISDWREYLRQTIERAG